MSLMSPRLEIFQPITDAVDTGLGFKGHFDWKLIYPNEEEAAVLIDEVSKDLGDIGHDIVEQELMEGSSFDLGRPERKLIVQCDGVLPAPLLGVGDFMFVDIELL